MTLTSLICRITLLLILPQQNAVQAPVSSAVRLAQIVAQHTIHTVTPVNCLFLDKLHHRLLAQVGADSAKPTYLKWPQDGSLASLVTINGSKGGPHEIVAVDFRRRRVIWNGGGIDGIELNINVTPFSRVRRSGGDLDMVSNNERENVACFVGGVQIGRNYRVYWPVFADPAFAECWAGVYEGNKLLKQLQIGYMPRQILYVPASNQVWFIQDWQARNLDGLTIPLPCEKPPDTPINYLGGYLDGGARPVSVFDIDSAGMLAYYIDRRSKIVYKFALTSGEVLDPRSLPIRPKSIVVDGVLNIIHLLDESG